MKQKSGIQSAYGDFVWKRGFKHNNSASSLCHISIKYLSPLCSLPSPALNPYRHTCLHILCIFCIAFHIHCFQPQKSNGFLLCTFLSHSSSCVQYASPKINNQQDYFQIPGFLGSSVKRRNRRKQALQLCFIISDTNALLYNLLIDLNNEDQKITSSLISGAMNHRLLNHCQIKQLACA